MGSARSIVVTRMGISNVKFNRLPEDQDIILHPVGEPPLDQSREEGPRSNPWRALAVVLALLIFCLLTVIVWLLTGGMNKELVAPPGEENIPVETSQENATATTVKLAECTEEEQGRRRKRDMKRYKTLSQRRDDSSVEDHL